MSVVDKLHSLYLFKDVQRRSLEEFIVHAPPVQFPRGSEVFRQGSPADVALLLIEGRLVANVEAGGETREIGEIRPGEIVGEQGLFVPGGRRSATVVAAEACECLLIDRRVMDQAATNPAVVRLEQQLLGTLARRIRKTNQSIQQAWKAESSAEPTDQAPDAASPMTLRQRLARLLGGT
ncbi:MAG: cyclic nucleotide-binding domain-containing protein [Myxococcota bacterium]|nr:cyclic nucleotide-binding domain-containing protein [Myxococcota bacterium]MEC8424764.1 cyclic nucleotide-binding domain-containing protein [Myxococcota bacterium]